MADDVVIEGDETPSGDTVVTVVTGADSDTEDVALGIIVGRLEAENAQLRERLDAVEHRVVITESTADVALDVAVSASATADEVAEDVEEVADVIEEDETPETSTETEMIHPDRDHFLWKNPIKVRH